MRRSRLILAGAVGVLVLASMAACAAPRDLPSSASRDELGAEFGACPFPDAEWGTDPAEDLIVPKTWHQVREIVEAQRTPQGDTFTFPAALIVDSGERIVVSVHTAFLPGIEWALRHDAEPWIGWDIKDTRDINRVKLAMIVTPQNEVFFAGNCMNDVALRFREVLGPSADALLAELPHVPAEELRDHFGW